MINSTIIKYNLIAESRALSKDIAFVNVKKCPACKEPINKDGGCSHMMCRCGCSFCWECLTPWAQHVSNGLTCAPRKVQETVNTYLSALLR